MQLSLREQACRDYSESIAFGMETAMGAIRPKSATSPGLGARLGGRGGQSLRIQSPSMSSVPPTPTAVPGPAPEGTTTHLMISGHLRVDGQATAVVEVRRTMSVIGSDGVSMGQVAGVLFDAASQGVIAIVLGNYTARPEYRLVDPGLVTQVAEGIRLSIPSSAAHTLPRYERSPSTPTQVRQGGSGP